MRILIGIWLVCCPVVVRSQFTYAIDQSIPVKNASGNALSLPWAGGLNATQYNNLDLDGDNKEDLVLFDRTANKPITLINEGGRYTYAPQYEKLFPSLTNWLLLRDFNCDGKKDIFTGDILGISVFVNVTKPEGQLEWEKFLFYESHCNLDTSTLWPV